MEQKKKVTITIVGAVTHSETFWKQFSRFNQATQAYLLESFPDFRPIASGITVTVDEISPDDLILIPREESDRPGS